MKTAINIILFLLLAGGFATPAFAAIGGAVQSISSSGFALDPSAVIAGIAFTFIGGTILLRHIKGIRIPTGA